MAIKVLVIEDDLDVRENIVAILELNDFHVITATDGLKGVYMARIEKPQIIVCDVMLPEMEGFDVFKELQQSEETSLIPFIFLTARVDRGDIRQGMELGADDYITKPFTSEELVKAINTRIDQSKARTRLFREEHQKNVELSQRLEERENYIGVHSGLAQGLAEELRDPISNINMAIHMLKMATTQQDRDKYIAILQNECSKELNILSQISSLRELLSAENVTLLRHFKLLK